MCNPTLNTSKEAKNEIKGRSPLNSSEIELQQQNLRKTIFYGSLSSALLIGGFSICMPYSQARRDELNCDTLCQGSMTSVRSFLNLLGSVIMGRISDGLGSRKPCLYIGALASFLDVSIMGSTFSIRGLWWSMVFGSLFQKNFSILKAMIADYYEKIEALAGDNEALKLYTSSASRASSVGKIGMSFGLSFMIGPLVGGYVVKSFDQAIFVGLFFVFLSMLCIYSIPSTTTKIAKSPSPSHGFMKLLKLKAAKSPAAIFFMLIRTAMGLAYHIFNTVWTVSLKTRFQFGPADYGRFFSFIGLGFALSQGFFAGRLVQFFGPKRRVLLIQFCCIALGVGRWFAFQTNSLSLVYILFALIITALGVMNTIITADTSKIASSDEIGGLLGLLDAVQSGAGMLGPIIGGILGQVTWGKSENQEANTFAPMVAVVGLYGFIFCLVLYGYDKYVVEEEQRREIHLDKKKTQ